MQEENNTQQGDAGQEEPQFADFENTVPANEQFGQNQEERSLPSPPPTVTWTASEYIAHNKDMSWYLALALSGVAITALVYVITQDAVTSGVFPVVAILFGVFAARQPQVLQYSIENGGMSIGQKQYNFDDFKSFTVHNDGSLPSIFFLPTKRFAPGLTIYFPPDQAQKIIDSLSLYLPHEDREPDIVDKLMKRVRF